MRRWGRRLLIVAGLIAVIVLLRLVVFRPAPVPVSVYVVDRGRVEETVVNTSAGTVESRQRSQMSPGIAGLVAEIPVKKGDRVTRGQVLLRLEDSELRAEVNVAARARDAARATQEEACASAAQADRELRRVQGLAEQSLVSDQAAEEAMTRAEASRAACASAGERVKQADAALAAAKATLEKAQMAAPFDGVVLDVTTEVGEWISPSPPGVFIPPVIDLIDPEDLYVSAPLDEVDVARVSVGLPARITLDAFRGRSFAGRISYVASYVETREEQNRTLNVETLLTEDTLPPNLLPGLSADVEVILDARDDVVRIPTYALLEGGRVLVVKDDRLSEVAVQTGVRNWEFTEIVSGVAEGDRVVVSLDRPEVKAGARVRVVGESAR